MESQFPKSKEYVPERWLHKEHPLYYGKAHPFAYSPFGFGVRMCAGKFASKFTFFIKFMKYSISLRSFWFSSNGTAPRFSIDLSNVSD